MSKAVKTRIDELIKFSDYLFNFDKNLLEYRGNPVELQHTPAEILSLLLHSPKQLVTRDQIIKSIWGSQVVDFDQNINFNIKCIRKALNDDSRHPQYIQTVPRKGYRFIGEVKLITTKNHTEEKQIKSRLFYHSCYGFIGLLLVLIATYIYSSNQPKIAQKPYDNEIVKNAHSDLKRAQYLLNKGGYLNIQKSILIFERVTSIMKQSTDAYAGLAIANLMGSASREQRLRSIEYAQKSYNKDSNNGYSNLAMGLVAFYLHWDLPLAQKFLEQATINAPQSVLAWHELSVVQTIRENFEEAEVSIENALAIDPGRVQEKFHAGWFYLSTKKYDKALDQCLQSLEIYSAHRYSQLCSIDAAVKLGLNQTAQKHIIAYMKLLKVPTLSINQVTDQTNENQVLAFYQWRLKFLEKNNADNFQKALAYAQLGNNKQALTSLQGAIQNHNMMVPTAWAFSQFDTMRKTNEFITLMMPVKR